MLLPIVIDERPSDGFSLVVPLPRRKRFQVTVVPGKPFRDATGWYVSAEFRVFTWKDD